MKQILAIFFLITLPHLVAEPIVVSGGMANDYEGWIESINDGRLMVVFCRNPDWASGDLYVTFSSDNGMTWDSVLPIIVEAGDQATLSFLQLPNDTFRVWYASNESGQYGIHAAHSLDGITWVREGWLDIGWSPTDMFYDPSVIVESDSSLTMSYRGPSGAYIAHKPHGNTWDTLCTLVGSGGYRPRVMKHTNGTYLYTYHRNMGGGQYEVFVRTSIDRITWSDETRLTFTGNSHDPFPNQTPDGAYLVYYATYQVPAYNLHRRRSYDAINWESDEQITADMTNNTQPHFFIENNTVYLLWAHCVTYPLDHDVYFEPSAYVEVQENTGIQHDREHLSIVPTICNSECTITYTGAYPYLATIEVFDIQGRFVQQWRGGTRYALTLNTRDYAPGVYFVRARTAANIMCGTLIITR
ncbi:hypothetical protein JXB22_11365 [candidate division WOR-3 bacterium]|nr:hypothetical protein [candidate division WOR-3 bacterium]